MNTNKAIQDLNFITRRLSGLIELGESVEEVQRLLNERDSLEKEVTEKRELVKDLDETIEVGGEKVKELDTQLDVLEQNYNARMKDMKEKVLHYEQKIDIAKSDTDEITSNAIDEADDIVTAAHQRAEEIVEEARRKVKEEEQKLQKITNEINKLKEKF